MIIFHSKLDNYLKNLICLLLKNKHFLLVCPMQTLIRIELLTNYYVII